VISEPPSAVARCFHRAASDSEVHSVLRAACGRNGVWLIREHRPTLIIRDIIMPERHGVEIAKEILASNPWAVILTMTGKDGIEDHNKVTRMLGARRAPGAVESAGSCRFLGESESPMSWMAPRSPARRRSR